MTGAQGSGILLWKGGAAGYNWTTTQNGGVGIDVREFHPEVVRTHILDESTLWCTNHGFIQCLDRVMLLLQEMALLRR